MEAKNWSEENKNCNIPETPKQIHWHQIQEYTYLGTRFFPSRVF